MNDKYSTLYNEMQKDLERTMQLELPETERISNCFWIAANYWDELKKRLCSFSFIDLATEIDFFRNVKPQFTGYIQYFTILSEALSFVPEKSENEISFWEEEKKRYDFFCNKHEEFVGYYKSGNTNLDDRYFTRALEDSPFLHPLMAYDRDTKFCSTHDWMVRGLVAHELYHDYVKKRLEGLRIWY